MRYWVSLATHGPRIDAGLRATVETVTLFEPEPERIIIATGNDGDRKKAADLLDPWSRSPRVRVIDTGCRGSGKKIWPAMQMREAERAEVAILTVDDDCYYQPDVPAVLMRGAEEYPRALVAMTVWTVGNSRWDGERFRFGMGTQTAGVGDGPNGAAGVWYRPSLPLDWRRLRRWSFDQRTEFADDVFIGGECRRMGVPVVAVAGLYRWGIRPLEGPHANDSSALYSSAEIGRRALNAFCLSGFMQCPESLRGTECDPDAAGGSEPVFAD